MYRVVWRKKARQRLDVLAFLARERGDFIDRIPRAIEAIELRLALNPSVEGESRGDNERVLIENPLSVIYEVFEAEAAVLIYNATVYPRRSV
jgi:hypothetical protein